MTGNAHHMDDAAAALAEYARGRRSALVAACWRAGLQNVRILALLAETGRQTIYTDLEREGINWAVRDAPRSSWQQSPVTQELVKEAIKLQKTVGR